MSASLSMVADIIWNLLEMQKSQAPPRSYESEKQLGGPAAEIHVTSVSKWQGGSDIS